MFDRFYWLYAFCREHVFRDDTDLIIVALWSDGRPAAEGLLLELGCGPGFYACRLADRFDGLRVLGIDLSERQIRRAQARASLRRLGNCRFEKGNALSLKQPTGSVNAVVASRLFTILPNASAALGEIHRVLEPGGRCFIAEPRSAMRASVPLKAMWLLAGLMSLWAPHPVSYIEPERVRVMTGADFVTLARSQEWMSVHTWQDHWYQYAVCEKHPALP